MKFATLAILALAVRAQDDEMDEDEGDMGEFSAIETG